MSDSGNSRPSSPLRQRTNTSLKQSTNPDLLRSATVGSVGGETPQKGVKVFQENDEFLRKWSGPLLLGPFLPAVFCLISVVGGHLVLNTWTGYCGYALDTFIAAAMYNNYVFLVIYGWAFLGHHVHVKIPGINWVIHLFRPFTTLKFLAVVYGVIGFQSFIIWAYGTALLDSSIFCIGTAPELYQFSAFLVITYWLGFFIVGCYLIKLKFGNLIDRFISGQAQGPSVEDMEERIFRKEFKKLDKKKSGTLPQELLSDFFVKVAVFVPEEEMPAVLNEIGVVGDAEVEFFELLEWFKKYNVKMAGYGGDDNMDDDDDEEDKKGKKAFPARSESTISAPGDQQTLKPQQSTVSNS